nr:biotin/lipoyl-containing protein [Streptomyces sp. DSM 41633]
IGQLWLAGTGHSYVVEEVREAPVRPDDEHSGDAELVSPMPGSVVAVGVTNSAEVTAGTTVVTVEAMKMEHVISAPHAGTVTELDVAAGATVAMDQILAVVAPLTDGEDAS